jgi:hypothetical protein
MSETLEVTEQHAVPVAGLVQVDNVVKSFGRVTALHGISFSVPQGQVWQDHAVPAADGDSEGHQRHVVH